MMLVCLGVSVVGASRSGYGAQADGPTRAFTTSSLPQLIRSVGLAFVFIPVSVAALSDLLGGETRGNATGVFNLTRELGGSIRDGVDGQGRRRRHGPPHRPRSAQHVTIYDPLVHDRLALLAHGHLPAEAILEMQVANQALVMSFDDGFRSRWPRSSSASRSS